MWNLRNSWRQIVTKSNRKNQLVSSWIICSHTCIEEHLTCPLPSCCVYHLCGMRRSSTQVHPPDTTLIQQQHQQQQHQLWMRPMKVLPHPPSPQEERHQLQLHPPVAGDNSTLRHRDSKSRPGSVTPTMRVSSSVQLVHVMRLSEWGFFQPEVLTGPEPTSYWQTNSKDKLLSLILITTNKKIS